MLLYRFYVVSLTLYLPLEYILMLLKLQRLLQILKRRIVTIQRIVVQLVYNPVLINYMKDLLRSVSDCLWKITVPFSNTNLALENVTILAMHYQKRLITYPLIQIMAKTCWVCTQSSEKLSILWTTEFFFICYTTTVSVVTLIMS